MRGRHGRLRSCRPCSTLGHQLRGSCRHASTAEKLLGLGGRAILRDELEASLWMMFSRPSHLWEKVVDHTEYMASSQRCGRYWTEMRHAAKGPDQERL